MQVNTISIIGLGSIGLRHAKNALILGYKVIGYDPSVEACEKVLRGTKNIIQIAENESLAINRSDAVIIASPHKYHKQSLENCINAGKSVLVEKPIATRIDAIENILKKAADKNLVIACGFNLRFRAIIEKAQGFIPNLGTIHWARFICASYLPDWRSESNYLDNYTNDAQDGGIIFDIAHELDLAQYLLGKGDVVGAFADNSNVLGLKAEDRASITLKHDTGALSHIYLDYTTRPRQRGFEIGGEKGFLKVNLVEHSLKFFDVDGNVTQNFHLKDYDTNYEYIAELKDFITAIEEGIPPKCTGLEGVRNLENILQARKLAGLI